MAWWSRKTDDEVVLAYLNRILMDVHATHRRMNEMALDLSKLNAAITRVSADVDVLIAAHTDPAGQTAVDAAAALLDGVSVKAEAAVAPPAPVAPPAAA